MPGWEMPCSLECLNERWNCHPPEILEKFGPLFGQHRMPFQIYRGFGRAGLPTNGDSVLTVLSAFSWLVY
jgi:hypothetical protein